MVERLVDQVDVAVAVPSAQTVRLHSRGPGAGGGDPISLVVSVFARVEEVGGMHRWVSVDEGWVIELDEVP
jgi:hypothetical protein